MKSDYLEPRIAIVSRFDRRRIRGLTMPPVHRFSPTRRANLNRAIQTLFRRADWLELECYYWPA